MTGEQLLEEASKFIDGFAASGDSGFAKRKRALQWMQAYERHTASRRLTAAPPADSECPTCGRPMESHSVRTPDSRTRVITCPA
jgi:hypothetical protein